MLSRYLGDKLWDEVTISNQYRKYIILFFEITNIVMISRLCRFDILLNRYRHDIFAINYGDEVTISNQHYNNIITEIDTIMT